MIIFAKLNEGEMCMNRKQKVIISLVIAVAVLVISGGAFLLYKAANKPEPIGVLSTDEYTVTIENRSVFAEINSEKEVIFQPDRNGAIITATIAPNIIYVLCDDILYSIDPDGGNRYKIASKCYNPGEFAGNIITAGDTSYSTLCYYNGYVYFIEYGSTSKLLRFRVGSSDIETLRDNKVSVFCISDDGILTGYGGANNADEREISIELDLNDLA